MRMQGLHGKTSGRLLCGLMKTSIFKTPRRGLMGTKPLGAEYMLEVRERARRMKAVTREKQPVDKRQFSLPGF